MPIAAPSSSTESGHESLEVILDHLDMVNSTGHGPVDMDLLFMKEVMRGSLLQNLVKAHDTLEEVEVKPCSTDGTGKSADVLFELTSILGDEEDVAELAGILQSLNFISLLHTHDDIATGNFGHLAADAMHPDLAEDQNDCESMKMIGVRKVGDKPLGITVRCSDGELVVARVLHGGIIDQQGLLHVGDVIKEINDVDVTNNPDAFHQHLAQSNGRVTLKIMPSYRDILPLPPPIYLRTFFSYDPRKDTLLPCSDIGLSFERGDVLCVVDRSDPDWWQAYVVGREETSGIVPSEELEEKRRAFVPSDHLYTKKVACGLMKRKKKKKSNYETRRNYEFDRSDIISYEEVQEMPPFHRKTLVLIGAQGVGRRVIVNRLIEDDPVRFGCAVASTSRPKKAGEVEGVTYNFVSRKELEYDIVHNQLLEYGEFMGNIYATSIAAVKKVCNQKKICVLDVNPQTLKLVRNSQYLPFVVFVKSPNLDTLREMHQQATGGTGVVPDSDLQRTVDESLRIEGLYSHMFDHTVVNNSLEGTCQEILMQLENLETQRQWVPITWVYDCP